jgi:hypothetical protein
VLVAVDLTSLRLFVSRGRKIGCLCTMLRWAFWTSARFGLPRMNQSGCSGHVPCVGNAIGPSWQAHLKCVGRHN